MVDLSIAMWVQPEGMIFHWPEHFGDGNGYSYTHPFDFEKHGDLFRGFLPMKNSMVDLSIVER